MSEIAYINGKFMPLENATVHVEDRGFQFADGVYEVVRTYRGQPFATDEHLARLFRSLAAIELPIPLDAAQLESIIEDGVRRAGFAEAVIYLQITRGRAPRHRRMPKVAEPTIVVTVRELPVRAARLREDGIRYLVRSRGPEMCIRDRDFNPKLDPAQSYRENDHSCQRSLM